LRFQLSPPIALPPSVPLSLPLIAAISSSDPAGKIKNDYSERTEVSNSLRLRDRGGGVESAVRSENKRDFIRTPRKRGTVRVTRSRAD
jgi:hypothetical protein